MKYDKKLIEIVKKKEFKTFWHCLDYLLIAGYTQMDAFGISMLEFGESRIYSDVAYIRFEFVLYNVMFTGENTYRHPKKATLIVGLIDDSNIHLSGLYSTYREWLNSSNMSTDPSMARELEDTCECIKIIDLTPFIIDYLRKTSKLHFGYEAFKIPTDKPEIDLTNQPIDRRQINRLMALANRPPQIEPPNDGDWENARRQAIQNGTRGIIDRADL